ncbi:uncharacterized protein LOC130275615 isoform X2 [Hyla sarda]|uniref:uncharacterized protein LOC130275615 isoform X2 n=1 Tax=Hyla sarda TaxID=327740 RepID=UPI0024C46D72|nr:uncharacterized protein LOC130275615 isoform X2 [Hyla sarda]
MELSPHKSIQSPPMPNNNAIDTPRTSNLKFLRAKRLSYFSKTKETQNVRQTTRTDSPRRCLSAPTSNRTAEDCDEPTKMNSEKKYILQNGERALQAKDDEKPSASNSPQDRQANLGKEDFIDIPSHHPQNLPTTELGAKKPTPEKKSWGTNRSIPNSLQPKRSKTPVLSIHHNQPPVTKEITESIQHHPQDPVLQSCHKEDEGKASSMNHNLPPTLKQVNDERYLPPSQIKPESEEVDVLSTHRSLLRSSFVTDLDQDLLEDSTVPETEKLHHVMTWAKKFLHNCRGGESNVDSSFESIGGSRVTDKYVKLNSVGFDEYALKKYPCQGEESKDSAAGQSQLLKSPTSFYKPELKHKSAKLDSFLAEPVSSFLHSDHDRNDDNFLEPSGIVYSQPVKNRYGKDKGYADSGDIFFPSTKQDCIDSNDILEYGSEPYQQRYSRFIAKKTKPDMAMKDNYINREEDSSSPDSGLNTERLNSLLEDLELIEKGLEKNGGKDGARTDRTFLVQKSAASADTACTSVSGKYSDRRPPALQRVDSNSSLSEGYMRKIYQECPTCSFSSSSSSNWCVQCGSALRGANDQPTKNTRNFELLNPQIIDDNAVEEFFSASNQRKRFDANHMSKQNAKELGRTVCWEDNSDVVSDSEGSVLDKYFFYVKQLDILRSQEKDNQTKHTIQYKYTSDTSSGDESSEDCAMPHLSGQAKPWGEAKTLGPDTYHFGDQPMKEKNVKESSEDIIETEGSSFLDRKLQKATNISSKVTVPKRYWEKSSIAWSSYTHGELKPRSKHNIQRPTSTDLKKNKDELPGKKSIVSAPNHIKEIIHGENDCNNNANEYKNVAVAYMKTSNAWAVSKHLCKDKWEMFPQNHQRMCEREKSSMWLLLPDELWIYIFALLSHGDLSKVAQVCQRFRYIANDYSLWKVIKVSNCHSLKDSCLVSVGLHHPESLSLYRCHDDSQTITEVGFTQLFQHCKDSLKLNITNCSGEIFKGDTILFYASNHCSQLTSVDISWTGATDKGIITLVQACVCLQSLSMNGCNITDNAITALLKWHFKSLIKLEIFGCHALTAKCLISVATECVQLDNLNIGKIPKADDVCLAKIASNLHNIVTLNLTGLSVVRDRAIHLIVKQCSKLENLTLSSCLQVTDVSLVEISTYRPTIKYLDLSGCKKVSDIGIQALARSCQQLHYLDLSSTGTGKRGICLLASYSYASLECLKLSFCKEVTTAAIEKLCKTCKRLKILHLYGCRMSPDLGYIKKLGKSLQILHDLSISTANILGK